MTARECLTPGSPVMDQERTATTSATETMMSAVVTMMVNVVEECEAEAVEVLVVGAVVDLEEEEVIILSLIDFYAID